MTSTPRPPSDSALPRLHRSDTRLAPPRRQSLARFTVLLVEDDGGTRDMYAEYLKYHGAHVIEAATLAGARRVLGSLAPDVVVIDLGLDGEDGADLLTEMALHPMWSRVPRVIASGRQPSADPLPEGVAFLRKPVALATLVDAIRGARPGHDAVEENAAHDPSGRKR